MKNKLLELKPFRRRVRLVRAWRGLAVGLLIGGIAGLVWSVLDLAGLWFTEMAWLAILFGACGLFGALIGVLWPIAGDAVARSVDRRAGLQDRLGTILERGDAHEGFDDALREDAQAQVGALRAQSVFPVRVGRWQYSAIVLVVLASTVFLLGNNWYRIDADATKAQAELAKIAAEIERVAKPLEDKDDTMLSTDERALAEDLNRFAKKLERGRLTKEEAMKRANELAKQAQKLGQKRVEEAQKDLQTARRQMTMQQLAERGLDQESLENLNMNSQQQELLQQLKQEAGMKFSPSGEKFDEETMKQLGLEEFDPSLLNLSEDEIDQLSKMIAEKLQAIDEQMQNADSMSEEQLNSLLQQQQELREMQEQLEMSEEMRKALEEFMNSPEFQDIMDAVNELREAARQVGNGEPLTEQQIEDLERMLDQLDLDLDGSKYQEGVMEQLRAALEQLKTGSLSCDAAGT